MSMQLTDTHCHIHEILGPDAGNGDLVPEKWHKGGVRDPEPVLAAARQAGVTRLICVGCTLQDSRLATEFAVAREGVWASIGIHPHEARDHLDKADQQAFAALATQPRVVAVGECGLDYFYTYSSKKEQEHVLRFQIELALQHKLPIIFHVREAFKDFWPIFDEYEGIRGVIHSFSSNQKDLDDILARGLYVGLNGIMTFTKNEDQLAAARAVPLDRLLLETDAPFLTPAPYRGTLCEPKYTYEVAVFLAKLRGESLEQLANATTKNAKMLFDLKD